MTRIGTLSGRKIERSLNSTLTFKEAAERSKENMNEKSKDLQHGFSAFRSAHAGMKRRQF